MDSGESTQPASLIATQSITKLIPIIVIKATPSIAIYNTTGNHDDELWVWKCKSEWDFSSHELHSLNMNCLNCCVE